MNACKCLTAFGHLQAGQCCAVLEEHGEKYLETWQIPALTWDELQELKQMYEGAPLPALESPLTGQHQGQASQKNKLTAAMAL
jgi:hypothetical protein